VTVRLDVVDRKILSELQKDASRSLDDIAKTIGGIQNACVEQNQETARSGG